MPEAAARCPACGRGVRAGTRFCPNCGQDLAAPVAAPAAAPPQRREENARFETQLAELKRVGWLFGLSLATLFVASLFHRGADSPWASVMGSIVLALITVAFVARRWKRLVFLFKLRPVGPGTAIALVAIALLFVAVASAYFWILHRFGVPFASASGEFVKAGWPFWSMVLLVSLMPAVFEELAFRGVIQSSLERVLNARDAWLIQAALFSVLHLSPLVFPSHFAMGLCFGYMRKLSRSIYPSTLLHAAWNALLLYRELANR